MGSLVLLARCALSDVLAGAIWGIFWFEVFVIVAAFLSSWLHESVWRREMKAGVDASLSAQLETSTTELLRMVCDAVFTVDENFCIEGPSLSLAALLLDQSCGKFSGVFFEDLICEVDRERFRKFRDTCSRRECVHIHLRDRSGLEVAVQLFQSRMHDVLGRDHVLIGVREDLEGPRSRQLPDAVGEMPFSHDHGQKSKSDRESEEIVSLSTASSEFFDRCSFVIDAFSPNLKLVSCTPAFTAIGGPMEGQGMLNWVRGDKKAFKDWVDHSTKEAFDGNDPRPMQVRLAPPHLRSVGECQAVCHLTLVGGSDDDTQSEDIFVEIVLSNLRHRRRKTRSGPIRGTVGTRPAKKVHLNL